VKHSLTIGRIAGVPIRLHWSFFLLSFLVLFSPGGTTRPVIVADVIWLVVLFASVTLHELSHSMVARRLGLKVRDIVLLPIGGVSEIESIDATPAVETKVAIAGPLASALIGGGLLLVALATQAGVWPPSLYGGSWLTRIGWLNLLLAGFNLLPALPMDGGRVLRSLLARGGNAVRATRIASVVAVVFGAAMIGYGLRRDYLLVLIGAFVAIGAASEWQNVKLRESLRNLQVGSFMHADQTTVPAGAGATEVSAWLGHFPGRGLPVVDELGSYQGMVDAGDLAGAQPGVAVGHMADREAPVLRPELPLFPDAVQAFQHSKRQQLAVVANGRVIGVLYLQPVASALMRARQQRARVGWSPQ
jgi:Zn-dependent protease